MINCHLTGGRHEKVLTLQTLSHTSARQEKFCRGYLMRFSVVCSLIDNDTCHQSDQNVVDSGGVISHNIKDRSWPCDDDSKLINLGGPRIIFRYFGGHISTFCPASKLKTECVLH